jgi:DMSO/TMAO reductase YedYZ heme-binding membrane subunit
MSVCSGCPVTLLILGVFLLIISTRVPDNFPGGKVMEIRVRRYLGIICIGLSLVALYIYLFDGLDFVDWGTR